jgi:type I restriction enzyme M protein
MNPSSDLVNKLWRLCAVLRKDGITYQQYVTELTYLLFLKMAAEQKAEEDRIPKKYRWSTLVKASETEVLDIYREALVRLGDPRSVRDRSVLAIFQNASTIVREPVNLKKLIDTIDGLHWYSPDRDAFGDAYEGLLQKKRGRNQARCWAIFHPACAYSGDG